ncbi:unnamed protein product [Prunus brigantina]
MGEHTGKHLKISRGDQARTSRQEGRQEHADHHVGISRASMSQPKGTTPSTDEEVD